MFSDLEEDIEVKPTQDNKEYKKNFNYNKKEEVISDPYVPIAMYVDKDFIQEAKTSLYNIACKLIEKGFTIRINGDDKEFVDKLLSISNKNVEIYIPWKSFNNIDSKNYFNTETSKHIASINFPGWEKIPDTVKAFLSRNVRMIFGNKNNSICLCLITWSKDGASRASEVTKETGKSSFIIRLASKYGFPVINISNKNAENVLAKAFNL